MKQTFPVRILDVIIIFLAIFLTGFSVFSAYIKPEKTSQVLIRGTNGEWIYPLDSEETVTVPGPIGDTVIRIQDGQAWVESSPCANQTCVRAGHLSKQGLWTACLPNNVFLMIEGSDGSNDVDGSAW
ncbi:MAG: NusG domain II-containing protein [Treponema sp.]|nr:NusG domain II-containing protein [Treponema sp.]